MITTDHFLKMGKDHSICEDYIISGTDPFPYVILADGCSTGVDTDVGARLLCYLAKKYITRLHYTDLGYSVINSAEILVDILGINPMCLHSTLLIACLVDNSIHVYVYGDGDVLAQSKSGSLTVVSVSFTNNAPYYLSYWNNEQSKETYKSWNVDKIVTNSSTNTSEIWAYDTPTMFSFSLDEYESVMIASDGIETFANLSVDNVAKDMLDFKSTKNRFVLRRARKVLREYEKQGITHYDDLSIGGFYNDSST